MARQRRARKQVVRREGLERPFNGGQWTAARFKAFIMTALRGARWRQKYICIEKAFVRKGLNPKTGKPCKLHRCEKCKELFPKGQIQADHIEPVIGPEGFVDWDTVIKRMFVEADGYQALCKECHQTVTNMERFGLDEKGAEIHRQVVDFARLAPERQKAILQSHECPPDLAGNAAGRRRAYHCFLATGSFEGAAGGGEQIQEVGSPKMD